MKYLKYYNENNSISNICTKYGITKWSLDENGLVDVDYKVQIEKRNLDSLPLSFGKVNGLFSIRLNNIKTLEGCPYYVLGNFSIESNKIEELKHSPDYIGINYWADWNNIKSLKHITENIPGRLSLDTNEELYDIYDLPNAKIYSFDSTPYATIFNNIENKDNLVLFKDMNVVKDNKLYYKRLVEYYSILGISTDIDLTKLKIYWDVNEVS